MLELGPQSPQLHREAGRAAAAAENSIGSSACKATRENSFSGAIEAGHAARSRADFSPNSAEAAEFLAELMQPGDLLLVKGSRGVKMERIVEALRRALRAAPAISRCRRCRDAQGARLRCSTTSSTTCCRATAHVLNVFRYITVRTALASLSALFLGLVLGPWMIRRLREMQIGQFIREEGPKSHQAKAGTPTMGGVLIVASTLIPTLLWADLANPYVCWPCSPCWLRRHRFRRRLQQGGADAAISASPASANSLCRFW